MGTFNDDFYSLLKVLVYCVLYASTKQPLTKDMATAIRLANDDELESDEPKDISKNTLKIYRIKKGAHDTSNYPNLAD